MLVHAVAAAAAVIQTPPAAPSGPPPATLCQSQEYRQFDFWVGRWDVYRTDTNQLVAHSLIEKLYNGCAVRENWMPLPGQGGPGGSLNSYRPDTKQWVQYWTDSGNNLNEYAGAVEDGKMVLTGTSHAANGAERPQRMVYEGLPDGSVTQTGYVSPDGGKTWNLNYKLAYRRAAQQ
jgi:hypothetical protein